MSINAVIMAVYNRNDGTVELELGGLERGQKSLYTENAPSDIDAIVGHQVWGGASTLMLGETEIAKRESYTGLRFTVDAIGPVIEKEKSRRKQ